MSWGVQLEKKSREIEKWRFPKFDIHTKKVTLAGLMWPFLLPLSLFGSSGATPPHLVPSYLCTLTTTKPVPSSLPPPTHGRSPKVHGPKVHKARARAFDYFECFRSLLAVLKFLEVLTMSLAVVGATIDLWQTFFVDGKNLQNYKKAPARAFGFLSMLFVPHGVFEVLRCSR